MCRPYLLKAVPLVRLKSYEREERGHMNKSYVLSNTVLAGSLDRGGRPLVNSIAVIPKLHMSADESYCLPWMSSGAIQQGWKKTVNIT